MNHEFWLEKWQTNDIGFNQANTNPYLQQYFSRLKLSKGATVCVPLCGKSIDMLWLLSKGYQVIGFELSQTACEAFFNDNNIDYQIHHTPHYTVLSAPSISLYVGDFFALDNQEQTALGHIDAIYDRAALIALPDALRKQYAKKIINLSSPNTQILLISLYYDESQISGPPFSVPKETIMTLYQDHFQITWLYELPSATLPSHLIEKGLQTAGELVCLLQDFKK